MTITVQAEDAFGNDLTSSGGLVTLNTTRGTTAASSASATPLFWGQKVPPI
jgi:hypothetical protein